jgi:hypothetical protein
MRHLPLLLLAAALGTPLSAQQSGPRPRPYPVFESPGFQQAVARGTRTRTGLPGPRYWQQRADYRLAATIDPASRLLTGRSSVRYRNNSPDTLKVVYFHLYQNLFAQGAARNREVPVTGGMRLGRVSAQGRDIVPSSGRRSADGYDIDGTILGVPLPAPMAPGDSADFAFEWSFTVAPDGGPRGGADGEVLFLSYWYPQVAVYDDVNGWQTDHYLGNAEFYMGYGDYDVAITVPEGWLIGATGELQNSAEVLTPAVRDRLTKAGESRNLVHIVADEDRGPGRATQPGEGGVLTWRFKAENVRDFAFGTSDQYLWDATLAAVGGRVGSARIYTFYRPSRRAWAWDQSARYAQHSIEFLSGYLWPYPYPQATAVDGVTSCAGMEYPMITCIGGRRDTLSLYSVTVHELAHMWFPMQVGSDEKRFSWQDEGLTRFNQAQGMRDFYRGYDAEAGARSDYLGLATAGTEVELMRHGDQYPYGGRAFGTASYSKMATNMSSLRSLVGEKRFLEAYREYGRRWLGKHPTPWDFFNTFNDQLGEDLSWFWRTWWYETWTLDQAIADVKIAADSATITIEDRGLAPMPARIAVRRTDGSTQRLEIHVNTWLGGNGRWTFKVRSIPAITSIEIDPEQAFPDINRANNVWRNLP